MKKQSLLSTFLTVVLLFYSLSLKAVEAKDEYSTWMFSDAELIKILNIRPFEDIHTDQAAKRLFVIIADAFKKSANNKIPQEDKKSVAECLATLTIVQLVSTQAFEQKLAKPEQLISDSSLGMNTVICIKAKSVVSEQSPKSSSLSVNDLLLDFTTYYGKEVIVKGYIVYNDIGSYLFHSKGNMNAVFLNNDRLSRESKKYLMGCGGGCEVTLKVRPSEEDSVLMKTAYVLSVVNQ